MDNVKKSKAGKIIKGCLIGIGGLTTVGCIGYVVKEVKREYDETVDENNRLRAFINDHDFYEKKQTNLRSSDYVESSNDEKPEEKKFDKNNPIYKQSPATMRKLGLNSDITDSLMIKHVDNSQNINIFQSQISKQKVLDTVHELINSGYLSNDIET